MKATVLVRPKDGILDPQGDAVRHSLRKLGFDVSAARVGRVIDLELDADDADDARAQIERMCAELLANPLIESFEIRLEERVTRPAARRRRRLPGLERRPRRRVGARRRRRGAGARLARGDGAAGRAPAPSCSRAASRTATTFAPARSPASRRSMDAVRAFASDGGPVLGICNGFQILCEARLLPGRPPPEPAARVRLSRRGAPRRERRQRSFMRRCSVGQELVIPVKHGEGAWYADEGTFVQLAARGQIVLRYAEDVNGSLGNVAGVVNEAGNVMGLMPHPEHAVDPLLGSADGGLLLAALVDAAAAHRALAPA